MKENFLIGTDTAVISIINKIMEYTFSYYNWSGTHRKQKSFAQYTIKKKEKKWVINFRQTLENTLANNY
jgi:hypothetical protein